MRRKTTGDYGVLSYVEERLRRNQRTRYSIQLGPRTPAASWTVAHPQLITPRVGFLFLCLYAGG